MTIYAAQSRDCRQSVSNYGEAKFRLTHTQVGRHLCSAPIRAKAYDYLDDGCRAHSEILRLVDTTTRLVLDLLTPGRLVDLKETLPVWVEVQRRLRGGEELTHPTLKGAKLESLSMHTLDAMLHHYGADAPLPIKAAYLLKRTLERSGWNTCQEYRENVGTLEVFRPDELKSAIIPLAVHLRWLVKTSEGVRWATLEELAVQKPPSSEINTEVKTPELNENKYLAVAPSEKGKMVTPREQLPEGSMAEQCQWVLVNAPDRMPRAWRWGVGAVTATTTACAAALYPDVAVWMTGGIAALGAGYAAALGASTFLSKVDTASLGPRPSVVEKPQPQDYMQCSHSIPAKAEKPITLSTLVSAPLLPEYPVVESRIPPQGVSDLAAQAAVINDVFASLARSDRDMRGDGEIPATVRVLGNPIRALTANVFRLDIPLGVRVGKVKAQADNIRAQLGATSVSIEMPAGETHYRVVVGRADRDWVDGKALLELPSPHALPLYMGRDVVTNEPIIADLRRMPHLLVGGLTGAGKSTGLSMLLAGLTKHVSPQDMHLVLIDAKGGVELGPWEAAPHVRHAMASTPDDAAVLLEAVVREMEWRYTLFKRCGVKNLEQWNAKPDAAVADGTGVTAKGNYTKLPWVVVVVDELSALMLKDQDMRQRVEVLLVRSAQEGRAAGINGIICTQKPIVDVVTPLLKGNLPATWAFQVRTQSDSRVLLDCNGAEELAGRGEFLFTDGGAALIRGQAGHLTETEIDTWIRNLKTQVATPSLP